MAIKWRLCDFSDLPLPCYYSLFWHTSKHWGVRGDLWPYQIQLTLVGFKLAQMGFGPKNFLSTSVNVIAMLTLKYLFPHSFSQTQVHIKTSTQILAEISSEHTGCGRLGCKLKTGPSPWQLTVNGIALRWADIQPNDFREINKLLRWRHFKCPWRSQHFITRQLTSCWYCGSSGRTAIGRLTPRSENLN